MPPENSTPPSKIEYLDGVFSDMYDRLVTDADDLSGMIAYGFYQLEKREWARAHYEKTKQAPPSNEVADFCNKYQASALKTLKERADGILFAYANAFFDEQYPAIQEKAFNERASLELAKLRDEVSRVSSLWHHIISHILSFAFFLFLVFFVVKILPLEPHIASVINMNDGTNSSEHHSSVNTTNGVKGDIPKPN